MKQMLTGNQAAALGAISSKVEYIGGYPITPATGVLEELSKRIQAGELDAIFVQHESEHSALAACLGASLIGCRSFSATSSHGLAYMHEMLHYAAAARAPMVLAVANRALGPGWNIWADLSDSFSQRDTGWIQIYCGSAQEIYDSIPMGYRVCEHPEVLLPAMVCYDGMILSHSAMPVDTWIGDFIHERRSGPSLDFEHPFTHGNLVPPEYFMELRHSIQIAHHNALKLIPEIEAEFQRCTGRATKLVLDEYRLEDACIGIIGMGALGSEALIAVDLLRARGIAAGAIRLRLLRPFPKPQLLAKLAGLDQVFVLDRAFSYGLEAPLYTELKSCAYELDDPPQIHSRVLGLGGRDVSAELICQAILGDREWIL